jgi:serine/threonine-protein kinase
MSPEQARGKHVDARTDIWAFACCLFEALTTKRAFEGETVSDTIAHILEREPDWAILAETTPKAVRTVLMRCLRRDGKKRVHHIADVRIDLDEAVSVPAEPSVVEGRSTFSFGAQPIAMTFLVGIAVGMAIWSLGRSEDAKDERVVRTEIAIDVAPGLTLTRQNPSVAISPDGRHIAFVAGPSGPQQLFIRSLDEPDTRLVRNSSGAQMPFFSPDGAWVGFRSNLGLVRTAVSGGVVLPLGVAGEIRGASWGADGWIVYNRRFNSGLSRIRAEGAEPEILTTPDLSIREKTHRLPEVLPGGKAVLFTVGTVDIQSYDDASIAVLDLETREYRVVLEGGMNPRYSPTGHLVYARNGALFAVPFNLDALEVRGTPTQVVTGIATSPVAANAEYAFSSSGTLVFVAGTSWGEDFKIVVVDRQGRMEPLVESTGAYFDSPRYSPDWYVTGCSRR